MFRSTRPLVSKILCKPHENASATRGFASTAPASRASPSPPRPYTHFRMACPSAPRLSHAHYRDPFARASIVPRRGGDGAR